MTRRIPTVGDTLMNESRARADAHEHPLRAYQLPLTLSDSHLTMPTRMYAGSTSGNSVSGLTKRRRAQGTH